LRAGFANLRGAAEPLLDCGTEMAELEPADEAYCAVEVSSEDGMPVIRLSGELDLVSVEGVRSVLAGVLTADDDRLAFDVSELEFMDSSGIALLVSAARQARQVELRHPTPTVRRLIELTGLTELLLVVR
jgi:anti-sigma B factor antagonist